MEKELISDTNSRLDIFISKKIDLSRSQIIKAIKNNNVLVNNKIINKPSFILKSGDKIIFRYEKAEENKIYLPSNNIQIDYVYKDKYLAVINKQRGIVVHPSSGHNNDTLVNYLFNQDEDYSFDENDNSRPGIVHRLDKDTQGLLVVAYDIKTMNLLQKMIQNKEIQRSYLALVKGKVKDKFFKVDAPLSRPNHSIRKATIDINKGRDAITHFERLSQKNNYSLLKCKLDTGRTHQIRAHLAYLNYPIVGDNLYGGKIKGFDKGQCLCAYLVKFIHPYTKKALTLYASLDSYFKESLLKCYS